VGSPTGSRQGKRCNPLSDVPKILLAVFGKSTAGQNFYSPEKMLLQKDPPPSALPWKDPVLY